MCGTSNVNFIKINSALIHHSVIIVFVLANFDISGAAIIMMAKHLTFVRDIFLNQGAAQDHGVQCVLHIVQ